MKEIWYKMPNLEGYYEYSNLLRIRSVDRMSRSYRNTSKKITGRVLKILNPFVKGKKAYSVISLSKDGVVKSMQVHKFFAKMFIPNPENKKYVNHKNGNKHDYTLNNLEWCTKGEDIKHAYSTGLRSKKTGIHHPMFGKKGALSHGFGGKSGMAKKVLDMDTGIIYDCIKDAALDKGIDKKNLCRYLKGRRKNKTSLVYLTHSSF